MTLETWLFAHGDIVWKLLLVGFALAGGLALPLWARWRQHRRNLERLDVLRAPRVRAPDPGLHGQSVIVHGIVQARQPGEAAFTSYLAPGGPPDVEQRGPLAVRAGRSMLAIQGPVEVCAGSTAITRRSMLSSTPLQCFGIAHGDRVAAYGVLERVPGSEFESYRQDAGAWRLRPGPGDEHVKLFFAGTPRAPWLRRGAIGAIAMAMFFYVSSSIAGYMAVAHPAFAVACRGFTVSAPAASAVASATPAFRDWGLRRHALYQPCVSEPGSDSFRSVRRPRRLELPTWPSD